MKNLLNYLAFESDELFVPNEALEVPFEHIDIDPTKLYILAKKLEKIAEQFVEFSREHIIAELSLSDEPTTVIDGVGVTLARVRNYEFPQDDFIDAWEVQASEQKKALKKLADAINNRKANLVEEGLAIELEPTYRITVR